MHASDDVVCRTDDAADPGVEDVLKASSDFGAFVVGAATNSILAGVTGGLPAYGDAHATNGFPACDLPVYGVVRDADGVVADGVVICATSDLPARKTAGVFTACD